jgi:hypothetical protein
MRSLLRVRIEYAPRLLLIAQKDYWSALKVTLFAFSVRDTHSHCQFGPPPVLMDTFRVVFCYEDAKPNNGSGFSRVDRRRGDYR